ncbi:hypothetical protein D3C76_1285980 [compost metagenome]
MQGVSSTSRAPTRIAGCSTNPRVIAQTNSGTRMKLASSRAPMKRRLPRPWRRSRKGICRNIAYISTAMAGVTSASRWRAVSVASRPKAAAASTAAKYNAI